VMDEPLTEFTVSSIRAMDGALAAQLAAWPAFREVSDHIDDENYSQTTAPGAARCRRTCTCIRSRISRSSASREPNRERSGSRRSRGG